MGIFWMLFVLLFNLVESYRGQIVYSVTEEASKGTVVGNISKDFNFNIQELESRTFQIASLANKKYFEVNAKNGLLFVNDKIDREELCLEALKCSLNLEAIAHNPLNIFRIEVNVLDINDNAPYFPVKSHTLNISENTFTGDRFPLPMADDADVGSNGVKSYKLRPNEHFSLDVQSGEEQSVSAELVLQKPLDREKQSVIHLLLTAVDGGKPPKTGTLQIIVNVLDINDNNPVFSKPLYKVRVSENIPQGTNIIVLNATDLDEGINGEIVFSFLKHGNAKALESFTINQETGEISVKGNLDYEENAAFEIRVQAKDKGQSPRSTHCKVLIEIIDTNDNAPEISVTSLTSTVREDATIGTAVALITVLDVDGGKNGAVNCKISESPFKLQSSYKNYYSLLVNGPLDRESTSHYNVTITATDEGTPPLSSTSVFTIQLSDVNDNAPSFPHPQISMYLQENSPVGTLIQTVSAVDADAKENAQIMYSLLDNKSKGVVSTMLNINSVTGEIYSTQPLNYEEVKILQFRVQATDSGVPPLSSNMTVNVFILDENDNSPGILPPYSDQGSVNTESIPYSAEAGYFVAKIRAVDADSGYNALLSYQIAEPKGSTLFKIATGTGEIRTKRRLNDKDLKTHPLVILISDNGEPSLSATVSIDILVVENNREIPPKFKQPRVKQHFSILNLYLLIGIVSVSLIFFLSLTSLIAIKCHKTQCSFSAPVKTTHPDGSWSYSKSTQQYDVCFSSDTLKSDVVVLPASCPQTEADLISINGADTSKWNHTLPNTQKVRGLSFLQY